MLIFDFGFSNYTFTIPILLSYILILVTIVVIILSLKKLKFYTLYKFITINFFTIWYFLLIIIFTFLTIYFYENINFDKINLLTIISCVLIGLLILPFFKKVVAFGIEAELDFIRKAENLYNTKQKEIINKPLSAEEIEEREKYIKELENVINNSEGK